MTYNLTDNEIKKALECCGGDMECRDCPSSECNLGCIRITCQNALELINRKDSKIAELTEENNYQKEEIEDLKLLTTIQRGREYYNKFITEIFQKEKGSNLIYPDFDEIYKRYFEQKAEIERLQSILLCFMDEVSKWENKHGLDISELPLIPIRGESEKIIEQIKAEAIKECLEKIEQIDVSESDDWISFKRNRFVDLRKEMIGE